MALHHHQLHAVGQRRYFGRRDRRVHRRARRRRRHALGRGGGRHHGDVRRRRQRLDRDGIGYRNRVSRRSRRLLFGGQIADRRRSLLGEIALRHALHVGDRDLLDRRELPVRCVRIAIDDDRLRERESLALGGFARSQGSGRQFVLRLGKLFRGYRGVAHRRDLRTQRSFALLGRLATGHDRIDAQRAGAMLGIEIGVGRLRQLVLVNQGVVQPRMLARRKDRVQHLDRRHVGTVVRRDGIADHHRGQRRVRLIDRIGRWLGALGFGQRNRWDRPIGRLDASKIVIDPGVELLLIEIAGDDQDRIVGAIIGRVERANIGQRC